MSEELFRVKVIALLHDPPWKPWSVTGKIDGSGRALDDEFLRDFGVSYYEKADRVHEREGLTFAKLLGITDDDIDRYIDIVRRADRYSASLERYAVESENVVQQRYKYNIFNPSHRIPVTDSVSKACVQDYVRWIVNTLKELGWVDKYHMLYALLEVAWYHFCPGYYPLADTRIGTYSVFDHVYATASMVNWFIDGELSGYLVKIDLPAIQQVISKSSNAWDLWGSSYLLSWLVYRTVEPLIWDYGVDIVLSPFMGLNPFFVGSLNIPKEVNGEPTYWEFNDLMFNPTQPVIPATVLIALPRRAGATVQEVKERIKRLYAEAWDNIVDEVGRYFPDKVRDRVMGMLRDAPITPVRVRVIDVAEAMRAAEGEGLRYEFSRFMYLIHLVNTEERYVKVFYGVTAGKAAHEVSSEAYVNARLYRLCTSCGVLPAVVEESDDGDIEKGERLCQYCYLKRKLRRYVGGRYRLQIIPSTTDIANIYNWRDILRHGQELVQELVKVTSEAEIVNKLAGTEEVKNDLDRSEERMLPEPLRVDDLDTPLNRLLFYYFTKHRNIMNMCVSRGYLRGAENYYAIVKGDGDYVGKKLWRGVVRGGGFRDYVDRVSAVEVKGVEEMEEELRRLGEIINAQVEDGEAMIPMTPDYLITLSRSLMVVALVDAVTVSRDGFLVYAGGDDVAFLAPISSLAALRLLIGTRLNYWGAKSIEDLRQPSSEGAVGFIRFGKMIFDAPAAYGRSYGVYITHHKDPFFHSWEVATRLEELKDEVEGKDVTIILRGRGQLMPEVGTHQQPGKEGEARGWKRLMLRAAAVIRNWELGRVVELYELIKGGYLSRSFIKDVLSDELVSRGLMVREALDYYVRRNRRNEKVSYEPPEDVNVIKAVDYLNDNYRDYHTEDSYRGVVKCLSS